MDSLRPAGACGCLVVALLAGSALGLPIDGKLKVRTITVYPTATQGQLVPDPGIADDLAYAGRAFGQIGLTLSDFGNETLRADSMTESNRGSWNVTDAAQNLLGLSRSQIGSCAHVYYVNQLVDTTQEGDLFGAAWPASLVNGTTVAAAGAVVDRATRRKDTVGHEIAHLLQNTFNFRPGEETDSGVHSNQGNDFLCNGTYRTTPTSLDDIYPKGERSQIRPKSIGRSTQGGFSVYPLIHSLYEQGGGYIDDIHRDNITVGIGGTGGAGLVTPPAFGWGTEKQITAAGRTFTVTEAARRGPMGTEEFTFLFTAGVAIDAGAANDKLRLVVGDLQSINGGQYTGFVADSIMVQSYRNYFSDLNATDFTGDQISSSVVFDAATGKLTSLTIDLSRARLAGETDIVVCFKMNIPAPASAVGVVVGLLLGCRRKR